MDPAGTPSIEDNRDRVSLPLMIILKVGDKPLPLGLEAPPETLFAPDEIIAVYDDMKGHAMISEKAPPIPPILWSPAVPNSE